MRLASPQRPSTARKAHALRTDVNSASPAGQTLLPETSRIDLLGPPWTPRLNAAGPPQPSARAPHGKHFDFRIVGGLCDSPICNGFDRSQRCRAGGRTALAGGRCVVNARFAVMRALLVRRRLPQRCLGRGEGSREEERAGQPSAHLDRHGQATLGQLRRAQRATAPSASGSSSRASRSRSRSAWIRVSSRTRHRPVTGSHGRSRSFS